MNREIEFRAKATNRDDNRQYRTKYKNGDWVYGLITDTMNYYGYAQMTNFDGVSGIDVDPNTLGQYVGLKDKNGTKIYEGDVVGVKRTYCNSGESEFALYSVVWNKNWCCWALDRVDIGIIQSCRLEPMETYEIVGNIYDTIFKMPK